MTESTASSLPEILDVGDGGEWPRAAAIEATRHLLAAYKALYVVSDMYDTDHEVVCNRLVDLLGGGDDWWDIANQLLDVVLAEWGAEAGLSPRQEAAAELAQIVDAAISRAYGPETGSPELQGRLADALQIIAELGGRDSHDHLDGLACLAAGH